MTTSTVTTLTGFCMAALFDSAIDPAELLIQQLGDGDAADHDVTDALFGELNTALAELPYDGGHRASTAAACESMAKMKGERLTARWQMTQLARRLRAQRTQVAGEDDRTSGVKRPRPNPRRPLTATVRE